MANISTKKFIMDLKKANNNSIIEVRYTIRSNLKTDCYGIITNVYSCDGEFCICIDPLATNDKQKGYTVQVLLNMLNEGWFPIRIIIYDDNITENIDFYEFDFSNGDTTLFLF